MKKKILASKGLTAIKIITKNTKKIAVKTKFNLTKTLLFIVFIYESIYLFYHKIKVNTNESEAPFGASFLLLNRRKRWFVFNPKMI